MGCIRMTKAHTHNIGLAIWRLKFFYETFVQGPTAVILLNFCAKNRHIAKPQTVSGKCNKTPFQMTETYIQDKTFDRNDTLTKGEYENCIFNSCNFADSDLSEFKFIDCTFNGCNFSLTKLNKTAFRDVKFKDCKMLGLRFDTCNEFGLSFSFDGCQLNHSSFYKTKIKKTVFKNSQLQETDFAEADLTSSVFDNCNLAQAVFDHTTLEKADFRTSYNYSIDPEINRIKKAKFSILGVSGLLDKYDINIEK